jgi:hypothetical protein
LVYEVTARSISLPLLAKMLNLFEFLEVKVSFLLESLLVCFLSPLELMLEVRRGGDTAGDRLYG